MVLTTSGGHRAAKKSLVRLGLLLSSGWLGVGMAGPGGARGHLRLGMSV